MFLEKVKSRIAARRASEDGMDLIEVLIAVVIIIACIIAVTGLLIRSQTMQAKNETEDRAALILQDTIEKTRSIPYASLATDTGSPCTSEGLPADSPCAGESVLTVKDSKLKHQTTTKANGTNFTVLTFVSLIDQNKAKDLGWDNVAATQEVGCINNPAKNTAPLTKQNGDGLGHLCTIKHVTVAVVWTQDNGETRRLIGSWVRSPSSSDELPASVDTTM